LSAVPIVVKVVAIWFEFVSMKNLLRSLAQFCSTVEVGSAGVLVFHLVGGHRLCPVMAVTRPLAHFAGAAAGAGGGGGGRPPVQLHEFDPEQNVCATPPSLTSSLSQQPL